MDIGLRYVTDTFLTFLLFMLKEMTTLRRRWLREALPCRHLLIQGLCGAHDGQVPRPRAIPLLGGKGKCIKHKAFVGSRPKVLLKVFAGRRFPPAFAAAGVAVWHGGFGLPPGILCTLFP